VAERSSAAFARLLALRPQLDGVATAGAAAGLQPFEMLHAGPTLLDPCRPPPVLLSSTVITCLHEGWARSVGEAEMLVRAGRITYIPAQSRGSVLPLAFIASPSTPMFAVGDGRGATMYAPVSVVRGSDTRFGNRDPGLGERLASRDRQTAPAWQEVLRASGPIELLPLAASGLARGDDLHSRTAAATEALAARLREAEAGELADAVAATPAYFLTLWMAATALMLRAVEGGDVPTLVTRAGGNGERFGMSLAGRPDDWLCVAAMQPQGRRADSAMETLPVSGAIGDSAVVDLLGFGAMAMAQAPEVLAMFDPKLTRQIESVASDILFGFHAGLGRKLGVDARRVVACSTAPFVALGLLAADGLGGLQGRGLFTPPVAAFGFAMGQLGDRGLR
jgi:hypothetical protein